jgi:hypothetical protein
MIHKIQGTELVKTTSYQDHEIMTARNQQVHWSIQLCQSKD